VRLPRRQWLQSALALPALSWSACTPAPRTPLAHLYGDKWVHGVYELYAGGYRDVQQGAQQQSFETYRVLAQKGIVALDALQLRGVPFFVRVTAGEGDFAIERKVPERLAFTAGMSEAQRKETTEAWNRAREHLHSDYEEVRRLNGALRTLLQQTRTVRNAIESGQIEQYRIVRKLDALAQGGTPPFPLPYQVSSKDYEGVLLLLLERLDDDAERLRAMEAAMVSVGLIARATDANSGSLSENLSRVLLAVVEDSSALQPRAALYPRAEDERMASSRKGQQLRDQLRASPGYKAWLQAERDREFEQIGSLISLLDQMTGLPISSVYRQVVEIWSGDADYLSYLNTLTSFIPGGSQVARTLTRAIDLTTQARGVTAEIAAGHGPELLEALAKKKVGAVLNTQSQYAAARLQKQLAFFQTPRELDEARQELTRHPLLQGPLPALLPDPAHRP
jgi:hypothetical protein